MEMLNALSLKLTFAKAECLHNPAQPLWDQQNCSGATWFMLGEPTNSGRLVPSAATRGTVLQVERTVL